MGSLFNIPETKSPRLRWMERYHITVKIKGDKYEAYHGMDRVATGPTEDDAITAAAKSLNIKLWNES